MDNSEKNQQSTPVQGNEALWYTSDEWKSLDKILEDDHAEEKLKKFELWIGLSKSSKLTFLTEKDAYAAENLHEAAVCRFLMTKPMDEHTPEMYLDIDQARMLMKFNIRRSVGTSEQKINERTAIISQMRFATPIQGGNAAQSQARSFLGRLFGR